MRVFIPKGRNTEFISNEINSVNAFAAFTGFSILGAEIVFYDSYSIPEITSREDVVVGWISIVKQALRKLNIEPPTEIDYPTELYGFYDRKLWQSTLHTIYNDDSLYPVFVKPVLGKQFDGKLITKLADLNGLGAQEDRKIWCSEPVDFIAEWRTFIRYDKIIDIRRYKGTFKACPDYDLIEKCVDAMFNKPAGFGMDFGLTKDGRTLLIEVNDGYAMGHYGLQAIDYAKLISARWHEMANVPDPLLF